MGGRILPLKVPSGVCHIELFVQKDTIASCQKYQLVSRTAIISAEFFFKAH